MFHDAHALEALYGTGHWLLSDRRPHDAAAVFRLMAVSAPEDERAWLGLGAAHEALGQARLAAELYRLATTLGNFPRCALARARALAAVGDAAADEAFTEALERARLAEDAALEAQVLADRGAS